jgi:hypothetical protein
VHSIQRAQQVGSVDLIIRPDELRSQIIAAVERGLARPDGRIPVTSGRAPIMSIDHQADQLMMGARGRDS